MSVTLTRRVLVVVLSGLSIFFSEDGGTPSAVELVRPLSETVSLTRNDGDKVFSDL